MPNAHIRYEVQIMLDQVKEHITDAEHMLATGIDRERVDVAGELTLFYRQNILIEIHMGEIDKYRQTSEGIVDFIREQLFNLYLRYTQPISRT